MSRAVRMLQTLGLLVAIPPLWLASVVAAPAMRRWYRSMGIDP